MLLRNKILLSIGIIITILILINPSPYDFRNYIGKEEGLLLKRKSNWLIFSIYQTIPRNSFSRNNEKQFLGIIKNFYPLDDSKQKVEDPTSLKAAADSAANALLQQASNAGSDTSR